MKLFLTKRLFCALWGALTAFLLLKESLKALISSGLLRCTEMDMPVLDTMNVSRWQKTSSTSGIEVDSTSKQPMTPKAGLTRAGALSSNSLTASEPKKWTPTKMRRSHHASDRSRGTRKTLVNFWMRTKGRSSQTSRLVQVRGHAI